MKKRKSKKSNVVSLAAYREAKAVRAYLSGQVFIELLIKAGYSHAQAEQILNETKKENKE